MITAMPTATEASKIKEGKWNTLIFVRLRIQKSVMIQNLAQDLELRIVKGSVPHNHIFWFSFAVTPLVGQRPDQMMFAFCR
jgi:hypothetical protein